MNLKKTRTAVTLKSALVAGLVMFGASGAVNAELLSNLTEGTVTLLDSLTGGIPSSSINESVSLSAGPVPIPDVPVTVCVGGQCVSTPLFHRSRWNWSPAFKLMRRFRSSLREAARRGRPVSR